MAEADWQEITGALGVGAVKRGVTLGGGAISPPPGGGSFIYGINTITAEPGASALILNQTNFTPSAKGGQITGALQRGVSSGNVGMSVFLIGLAQGQDASDDAYLLGISDADPGRIVLAKGPLATGLPDADPGQQGILARSTDTVALGEWIQLRLELVVNLSGDVVINCYANDLTAGGASVATPTWLPIPGMGPVQGGVAATAFIDDALGVNSGSAPFASGYWGFGGRLENISRRVWFDQISVARQT